MFLRPSDFLTISVPALAVCLPIAESANKLGDWQLLLYEIAHPTQKYISDAS